MIALSFMNPANSGKNLIYPLSRQRERKEVRVAIIMARPLTLHPLPSTPQKRRDLRQGRGDNERRGI